MVNSHGETALNSLDDLPQGTLLHEPGDTGSMFHLPCKIEFVRPYKQAVQQTHKSVSHTTLREPQATASRVIFTGWKTIASLGLNPTRSVWLFKSPYCYHYKLITRLTTTTNSLTGTILCSIPSSGRNIFESFQASQHKTSGSSRLVQNL